MEKEIKEKLSIFLKEKIPFTEESQVVYLMVEIRKLLDLDEETATEYSLLHFYCDWTVHTQKDRITEDIKKIMEKINQSIPKDKKILSRFLGLHGYEVMKFIYMKALRKELRKFLKHFSLSNTIVSRGKNWIHLVNLFTKILADQPIINPIKEIKYFAFESTTGGIVSCVIQFNDQRNRCRFTDFMIF